MNFSKFYTYLCSYESILVILLIFLTIGNIILLSKTPSYLLLVNLLLLLGYFLLSKRNDKMIILISIIHFSIWGILIESFIIKKTNFALKYKTISNNNNMYVPLWLFTIYCVFMISAIYTYNIFSILLK